MSTLQGVLYIKIMSKNVVPQIMRIRSDGKQEVL